MPKQKRHNIKICLSIGPISTFISCYLRGPLLNNFHQLFFVSVPASAAQASSSLCPSSLSGCNTREWSTYSRQCVLFAPSVQPWSKLRISTSSATVLPSSTCPRLTSYIQTDRRPSWNSVSEIVSSSCVLPRSLCPLTFHSDCM